MGTVTDLYQVVRDLIDEAKKQKNMELVDKLIDIKLQVSDIQDENSRLKKELEQLKNIERHTDGTYITLKDDELKVQYCSTCWGKDSKLIQLREENEVKKDFPRCPICFDNWLRARNSGK
jgi:predicted nuclease with TOPRIM domain